MSNFHPFEVVDRGSEPQLDEKLNYLIDRFIRVNMWLALISTTNLFQNFPTDFIKHLLEHDRVPPVN